MRLALFSILLGLAASSQALICRSGFNVSLSSVPMYQWNETLCRDGSKCFGQEIQMLIAGFKMRAEYGGCVSSGYSHLLTCRSLFGTDSTTDPARLLDMIPDMDKFFREFLAKFQTDALENFRTLFSGGENTNEFVSGCVTFVEKMGFNVVNIRPLEPSLTKLFNTLFRKRDSYAAFIASRDELESAINDFLDAIENLDTDDHAIAQDLYDFLQGVNVNITLVKQSKYAVLINKLPGLIRSVLPKSFQTDRWFNEIFLILSKINMFNPKETVENMVEIMKGTDWVPSNYKQYTDPFLDSLPELVIQLFSRNTTYPAYWSTLLLKEYSSISSATTKLSESVIQFLDKFNVNQLDGTILNVINYLPGHMYKYFPNDKAKIDDVYNKIADGLDSVDFSNPTNTLPATNMSNFIIDFIEKISPGALDGIQQPVMTPIIINFSHTFYALMEPDYNDEVDIFFNTLIMGFENYPTSYNVGQIIRNLVINFGGKVPAEIDPLLHHMQNVLASLIPFNQVKFFETTLSLTDDYKTAYPNSPLPPIVEGYIKYAKKIVNTNWLEMSPQEFYKHQLYIQNENINLNVDMQFAFIKMMDLSTVHIKEMLASSFPAFGVYINAMSMMDAEDVKELMQGVITWFYNGLSRPPLTSQGLVDAIKPSIEKITSKLGEVMKDVRYIFAPDLCRDSSCSTDNCNTHDVLLRSAPPVTKDPSYFKVFVTTKTTTSKAGMITHSPLVYLAGLATALKIVLG